MRKKQRAIFYAYPNPGGVTRIAAAKLPHARPCTSATGIDVLFPECMSADVTLHRGGVGIAEIALNSDSK